jgi:hypothetical protein
MWPFTKKKVVIHPMASGARQSQLVGSREAMALIVEIHRLRGEIAHLSTSLNYLSKMQKFVRLVEKGRKVLKAIKLEEELSKTHSLGRDAQFRRLLAMIDARIESCGNAVEGVKKYTARKGDSSAVVQRKMLNFVVYAQHVLDELKLYLTNVGVPEDKAESFFRKMQALP